MKRLLLALAATASASVVHAAAPPIPPSVSGGTINNYLSVVGGPLTYVPAASQRLPIATDDSTKGYAIGSMWLAPGGVMYIAQSVTAGAAKWALSTQPIGAPIDVLRSQTNLSAAAAYGTVLLANAYAGNAVQVTRAVDNTTFDVPFTTLNTPQGAVRAADYAKADAFCAGTSTGVGFAVGPTGGGCWVSKLYDQSGNALDATIDVTGGSSPLTPSVYTSYTTATGVLVLTFGSNTGYTAGMPVLVKAFTGANAALNGIWTVTAVGGGSTIVTIQAPPGLGALTLSLGTLTQVKDFVPWSPAETYFGIRYISFDGRRHTAGGLAAVASYAPIPSGLSWNPGTFSAMFAGYNRNNFNNDSENFFEETTQVRAFSLSFGFHGINAVGVGGQCKVAPPSLGVWGVYVSTSVMGCVSGNFASTAGYSSTAGVTGADIGSSVTTSSPSMAIAAAVIYTSTLTLAQMGVLEQSITQITGIPPQIDNVWIHDGDSMDDGSGSIFDVSWPKLTAKMLNTTVSAFNPGIFGYTFAARLGSITPAITDPYTFNGGATARHFIVTTELGANDIRGITLTCTPVLSSVTMTCTQTTGQNGMVLVNANLAAGTTIASGGGTTTLTLSLAATGSASGVSVSGLSPLSTLQADANTYASTVKALGSNVAFVALTYPLQCDISANSNAIGSDAAQLAAFNTWTRANWSVPTTSGGLGAVALIDFAADATLGGTIGSFTGSISGTTLTTVGNPPLVVNEYISGVGVTNATFVSSGSGNSWVVSNSQTVGSETLTYASSNFCNNTKFSGDGQHPTDLLMNYYAPIAASVLNTVLAK